MVSRITNPLSNFIRDCKSRTAGVSIAIGELVAGTDEFKKIMADHWYKQMLMYNHTDLKKYRNAERQYRKYVPYVPSQTFIGPGK